MAKRILRLPLFVIILSFFYIDAKTDCKDDGNFPIGKWVMDKSGEFLQIKSDKSFIHSKLGAGDLRHVTANRYEITFFKRGRQKMMRSCMVTFAPTVSGKFLTYNVSNNPECNFGALSKADDFDPSRDQNTARPVIE